nr:E3 UFM1-protein ligase 1 homolog [Ipomoea trifida]
MLSSLAKSLPGSLSVKATALLEALEGKQVEMFMTALRALAEESGLILKKLDKKLERTFCIHIARTSVYPICWKRTIM